jgi:hypothetical protein
MANEQKDLGFNSESTGHDPYNHVGQFAYPDDWMHISQSFEFTGKNETVFYTRGRNWFQRWAIGFLFGWRVVNE